MDLVKSLENVRILLGLDYLESKQEDLINLYLSRATNFVKSYCKVTEIPLDLETVIEDIAVIKFRLHGVEGVKSEGKGSISETYIESLPADIINQLNTYRSIKVL
jgi:Phage gp6-like head-tail connector protein